MTRIGLKDELSRLGNKVELSRPRPKGDTSLFRQKVKSRVEDRDEPTAY